MSEFAAWCITSEPPLGYVPFALFQLGEPLAVQRQEQARKAAGRYTFEEAAEHLQRAGESYQTMLARLKEAAGKERDTKGALPTHNPGREVRNVYGAGDGRVSCVRVFYEHVYWDDLNRWLDETERRITFRFPAPMSAAPAQTSQTRSAGSKAIRALGGHVRWFRSEWNIKGIKKLTAKEKAEGRARSDEKTIRSDLKEAAQTEKSEGQAQPFATDWWPNASRLIPAPVACHSRLHYEDAARRLPHFSRWLP